MEKFILISAAVLAGLTIQQTAARADTVLSVTEVHYDVNLREDCVAIRMNPATFNDAPSSACIPKAAVGTSGPDRITKKTYDVAGQVTKITQAYGTSDVRDYATYYYNVSGTKLYEVDARNFTTQYRYDGFNRLDRIYYPCPATQNCASGTDYEEFAYDANNNRTSYRHRNAQTVLYTYDNLNRETVKDLPAYAGSTATSKDIYTGYDGLGHIIYKRFASASGSGVTYAYDGLGRVTSTTDINGRIVWYGYNADSTRSTLSYPDAIVQFYYYNNDGKLRWTDVSGTSVIHTTNYDSLGRITSVGRSNAANSFYAYDAIGRLTSMTHDFAGTANDITWSFNAYNAASQITNWNASTAVYDYVETATDQTNKTYDGLNRDASIAAVSGGYDSAGNMANDGVRTFTYDVENRLITGSSALTALALNYDPEGRLYSYTYNGGTMSFLYDGTNLIGEYDGTGAMTRRYMHTLGTDQPWVQFIGSAVGTANATYLYSNYQGSIIAMADMSGNVASSDVFKYGPYGEPRNAANAESWTGSRFRYTGQTVIPEAKLYYYKARVYDPIAGRFLQTDPIGSKDDLDLYAYVGGDPINQSDPTGLYICDGTDKTCGRLAGDLATLQKAANAKGTTTAERKAINAVLGAYGKEGEKNGVTVRFGNLSGAAAGNTSGSRGNITVTLDYAKIDKYSSSSADRRFLGASVTAHEGGHVDDRANGRFSMSNFSYVNGQDGAQCRASYCVSVGYYRRNEVSAFTTQAIINNALNYRSGIVPSTTSDAQQRGYDEGNQECERSTANGIGNCSY